MTRADFDGLACGVLLVEKGIVDDYLFVHPKDVQDGNVEITSNDVLANVPYAPGCGLWFDHHASEEERLDLATLEFEGVWRLAPSAAQVIWDHYGGAEAFGEHFEHMLTAVNKSDTADFTEQEILSPEGWILLSFIIDPRTGLERFDDYGTSQHEVMLAIIQYCRSMLADEILQLPDVQKRSIRYWEHQSLHMDMLKWVAEPSGNVIVTRVMDEETIPCGNRFVVFAMYPEQNVEVRVFWGKNREQVVFAVGHSIINRSCTTNIGKLMLEFGGGGHPQVGSCRVSVDGWREKLAEVVDRLREDQ